MCYCITKVDIDVVINEWPYEWRIPFITWEMSETTTEGEAEQEEIQPPEIQVPKKPQMSQGKTTQEDEGFKQTRTQKGKGETTYLTNEQLKQLKEARETTPNPITQEPRGNKRPISQEGGMCNKSKVKQASPDYMIMEDDGEMIAIMV
jgi:hypothetical protein